MSHRIRIKTRLMIASFVFLSLSGRLLPQATRVVPSPSYPTIQAAINAAAAGDIVQVAAGTYFEHIDFLGKAITVVGAGAASTTINGGGTGSVVSFVNDEQPTSILDGFTITGGAGTPYQSFTNTYYCGGGVLIGNFLGVIIPHHSPTIRNCVIQGNSAQWGAGIFCWLGCSITVQNTEIVSNTGIGVMYLGVGSSVFRNCRIAANTGGGYSGTDRTDLIESCVIENNTGAGGVLLGGTSGSNSTIIRNCIIRNNSGNPPSFGVPAGAGGLAIEKLTVRVENCLIYGNTSFNPGAGVYVKTQSPFAIFNPSFAGVRIVNSTIVGNSSTTVSGGIYSSSGATIALANSIVRGNSGTQFAIGSWNPIGTISTFSCNVEGGYGGSMDLDPLFFDQANADYRLTNGSPCINAGTQFPNSAVFLDPMPTTDFFGSPRNLYGGVDIGFHEANEIGLDPVMQGNVMGLSGPFEPLTVNGSTGGIARTVSIAVGQPISVAMAQPPISPSPSLFAIFGVFAIPSYADTVVLPFGLGSMAFVPCPIFPSGQPLVFTLANNFGVDPCGALVTSSPAPWTPPSFGGIPFPIDFTLQGLIEEGPGTIRVTNGIVVRVQ